MLYFVQDLVQFTIIIIVKVAELQMQDAKNVVVHNLSPGMVTTDLLMSGATTKRANFFINVLAEPSEVMMDWILGFIGCRIPCPKYQVDPGKWILEADLYPIPHWIESLLSDILS
ncbi:hypothetical protein CRYUN_Cryun41cG0058000 [Craigia yunnanensis]